MEPWPDFDFVLVATILVGRLRCKGAVVTAHEDRDHRFDVLGAELKSTFCGWSLQG